MSNQNLDQPGQALALSPRVKLSGKALGLLLTSMTPRQYLQELLQAELYPDAVRLLGWALERRAAVWWACLCVRAGLSPDDPPGERAALEAAERWVADPSDDPRRAAGAAAEAVDYGTPAGCAAMAAFWSGGSLAPAHLPAVAPPEHLLPTAATNAVLLAVVRREPEKADEKYRRFLALGAEVADGKNRWKETPAAAAGAVPRPPAPPRPVPPPRPPVPRRP